MGEFQRSELERLESLGDNCELGFVLRRLGWEDGMLFRWASIQPECLLATLRGDFAAIYAFENLVAHRDAMVLDRRYGTAWHSGLTSRYADGQRRFLMGEAERRAIHATEQMKRSHLVAKLRRKFAHPNPVFVLKCNETVAPELVEAVHYQLYRRIDSPAFVLLEVRADPARAGTVEPVGRTLLRGYVSRFASYDDAENGDDPSWHAILARALAHHGQRRSVGVGSVTQGVDDVVLPFPATHEPSLARTVAGDVRAGVASLLRGNAWCRLVDDDLYRLHAGPIGAGATELRWSGVHLPPGMRIELHAQCAIPDSRPVRARLAIRGAEGGVAERDCVFRGTAPDRIMLEGRSGDAGALTISLTVEPLAPLGSGERAVIDVQPIVCRPADPVVAEERAIA